VLNIVCFNFNVISSIMEHIIIYSVSGSSAEGSNPISSALILKINKCYKGVLRELKKFT
jgi:hypothetical protein